VLKNTPSTGPWGISLANPEDPEVMDWDMATIERATNTSEATMTPSSAK